MEMENNKAELNNLMELPSEILIEILKRLPTKTVCCIRCVSKTLLSIVDAPSFVTLHTRLLIGVDSPHNHVQLSSSPQLILRSITVWSHYAATLIWTTTLQLLNYVDHANVQGAQFHVFNLCSKHSSTSVPDNNPYVVHFVFCNLLWFGHDRNTIDASGFVIDPLKGEVLRLPPIHNNVKHVHDNTNFTSDCVTGMGFDSITNTFKILLVSIVSSPPPLMSSIYESHVLVLGTSEWRRISSVPHPASEFLDCAKNNVCAFGDMHWLVQDFTKQELMQGSTSHIVSFDFKKEEFFYTPSPYILPNSTSGLHFISFRGSMALVDTTSDTSIEIWVMKDYNTKQWMHDYSIVIQNSEWINPFMVCCEWEHGILFSSEKWGMKAYFLDLRSSVNTENRYILFERRPCHSECTRILSPSGSLISVKSYANLVGEEEPTTYRNWEEGEASGKNFFYLTS